jgi:3-deoxy-manno-octulosonate cytidylyltransferase (CMP-KDO synthetase)
VKFLGVIPARYASTRFPGKPLAMINGRTMIRRVYDQVKKCPDLADVYVATDDSRIFDHVKDFGGNVIMTSPDHKSGTERCQEVAEKLGREVDFGAVINIQGDEPFLQPAQISELIGCFRDPHVQIGTLVKKIHSPAELLNANVVKVVFDKNFRALYFSRNPIPYLRGTDAKEWTGKAEYFKHIGIYGYCLGVLNDIVRLPLSPLEKAESLEQLRWMESGYAIHVRETYHDSFAVDTEEDLLKITNKE